MLRKSTIAGLATALVALCLGVGATSAFAQNVYVCQVNGAAGQLTPGVENVVSDLGANNGNNGFGTTSLPQTGTPLDNILDRDPAGAPGVVGSYTFDSANGPLPVPTVCADVNTTGVSVGSVRIQSSGTYIDTVCGTGTAHSAAGQTLITPTAILAQTPGASFNVPSGTFYDLDFVGGS